MSGGPSDRGQIWVIAMREYHVECVTESCENDTHTGALDVTTKRAAEKQFREEGWTHTDLGWLCKDCSS